MYIKSNIHESKLVFIHYANSLSEMQLSERPVLMCVKERDQLLSILPWREEPGLSLPGGGKALQALPRSCLDFKSGLSCAGALREVTLPLSSICHLKVSGEGPSHMFVCCKLPLWQLCKCPETSCSWLFQGGLGRFRTCGYSCSWLSSLGLTLCM